MEQSPCITSGEESPAANAGGRGHNLCCHYCRISAKRQRSAGIGYIACATAKCRMSYCHYCLRKHFGIPDPATLVEGEWTCQRCNDCCCCQFSSCLRIHKHCFTYRRTQLRHSQVTSLKWTKKKHPLLLDDGTVGGYAEDVEPKNKKPRLAIKEEEVPPVKTDSQHSFDCGRWHSRRERKHIIHPELLARLEVETSSSSEEDYGSESHESSEDSETVPCPQPLSPRSPPSSPGKLSLASRRVKKEPVPPPSSPSPAPAPLVPSTGPQSRRVTGLCKYIKPSNAGVAKLKKLDAIQHSKSRYIPTRSTRIKPDPDSQLNELQEQEETPFAFSFPLSPSPKRPSKPKRSLSELPTVPLDQIDFAYLSGLPFRSDNITGVSLTTICQQLGVPVKGRRSRLVNRIMSKVPSKPLAALVPNPNRRVSIKFRRLVTTLVKENQAKTVLLPGKAEEPRAFLSLFSRSYLPVLPDPLAPKRDLRSQIQESCSGPAAVPPTADQQTQPEVAPEANSSPVGSQDCILDASFLNSLSSGGAKTEGAADTPAQDPFRYFAEIMIKFGNGTEKPLEDGPLLRTGVDLVLPERAGFNSLRT